MPDFPQQLSHTIAARHATLEQLASGLRTMGTPVSIATLSYWQTGRSTPARASSLRALRNLEVLLEVAPGYLSGTLEGVDKNALWGAGMAEDGLQGALAEMGLGVDRGLVKLMLHEVLHVDHLPGEHQRTTRQLMRAVSDEVVHLPVVVVSDGPRSSVPVVEATAGCHVGEVTWLDRFDVSVTELVLQRPLHRGEATQISYRTTWTSPTPPNGFSRQVRLPVHYLALEARLNDQLAQDVHYEYSPPDDPRPETTVQLPASTMPQYVGRNLPTGNHSLAWSWE